jgi:hypothetical protein
MLTDKTKAPEPIKPRTLPEEVGKKYKLTGGHEAGKILIPRIGEFDLSKITLEEAEKLSKHIPFLVPINPAQAPSASPGGPGK